MFLAGVVVLNYLIPKKYRWALLLVASCIFYMAFIPKYILILFTLIAIDYTMAILIERSAGKRRTQYLLVSILATVGMLFIFKYFNFFTANIALLAHFLHWNYSFGLLSLIVPLGLSFHTFQSLSYVIEVYRGTYKAERHLGIYALYVLFFPQLIAGPIERPQHLLPQLKNPAPFSVDTTLSGIRLMTWGYFKKLVIADRVGMSVDYVWANYSHLSGLSILFAIFFFAFQLYADFSGYVDIARGSARILGVDLTLNFERPYFSASITEFWRRWHISLSTWFRDYVFIPLGLKIGRFGRVGAYAAVLITFTLMGLWHGAGWTYVTMGLLFGLYIVMEIITKSVRTKVANWIGIVQYPALHKVLQQLTTFCLVALTWTFFRAPSITEAFGFLSQLFVNWHVSSESLLYNFFVVPYTTLGFFRSDLLIAVGGIAVLLGMEAFQEKYSFTGWYITQPLSVRTFIVSSAVLAVFIFSVTQTREFIYFQF